MVANLVLQLITQKQSTNFKISSNDENFGAFDDVVVEIEDTNYQTVEKYALQLKHVTRDRQLNLEELAQAKGNYSIKKYFESFQKFKNTSIGYKLILMSNLRLDIADPTLINIAGGESLQVEVLKHTAVPFLNTSKEIRHCYKFRVVEGANSTKILNEYRSFFENFYLYTHQSNVDELKSNTSNLLKQSFVCDDYVAQSFFQFIKQWSVLDGTKEKLDKDMMQKVLALHVLSPHMCSLTFGQVNDSMILLREAISTFAVALFDSGVSKSVQQLWGDLKDDLNDMKQLNLLRKRYQITKTSIQSLEKLSDDDCSKFLWLMDKCPLIVQKNESALKILELCKNCKFVLLGSETLDLGRLKVFRKLSDLEENVELFEKITTNFRCSIQAKREISLKDLIEQHPVIEDFVTTTELLKMVSGPLLVGDEQENCSKIFISRLLSRIVISHEYLEKSDTDTIILVNPRGNDSDCLEEFSIAASKRIIHVYEEEANILKKITDDVTLPKFHCFRLLESGNLEWVTSRTDILDLQEYCLGGFYTEEDDLHVQQAANNINIVSGCPGIGKSTFLRNLKNNLSSKFWTILFTPQDILALGQSPCTREACLTFVLDTKYAFLGGFERSYLKLLMEQGEVIYLWDALDEINRTSLVEIVSLIGALSKNSVMQWMTCRNCFKEVLEGEFKVFSRRLVPFDDEQMTFYVREYLRLHNRDIVENLILKIKNIVARVDDSFLRIPLHLHMLMELVSNQPVISEQEILRRFVEEKFNIYYREKAKIHSSNRVLGRVIELEKKTRVASYQNAALYSLIDAKYLKHWNVACDSFLEEIKKSNDRFGFIAKINNEKAVFVHESYSEYFAGLYIFAKWRTLPKFKKFYFDKKYTKIRYFFDLCLARNSPAHLAVLHQDLDLLKHNDHQVLVTDSAGRNVLHLACSWGVSYPNVKVKRRGDHYVIDDTTITAECKSESTEYLQILEYLLERISPRERDELFGFDSLTYAKKFNCLTALVFISNHQKDNFPSSSKNCFPLLATASERFLCTISYFSAAFGDGALLNFFENGEIKFVKRKSDGASLLHVLVARENVSGVQRLLFLDSYVGNIDSVDKWGHTALFLACKSGHADLVELLMRYGAKIGTFNNCGKSCLHVAAECGHYEIVVLLVNLGANIGVRDKNYATALDYAYQNGHEEVVRYLTNQGS